MTDNNTADRSLVEKAYRMRRWGLLWIVMGFIILTQQLNVGRGLLWFMLDILLIGLAMPGPKRQTRWTRGVLEYAGYLGIPFIVLSGLNWFSGAFSLNTWWILSVASLSIGIFLQVWAELLWRPEPSGSGSVATLIDKIKHL